MNYAQTNLQLMNQLVLQGYDGSDRALVAKAYCLAMRLYTGWFRPSGKTFIAHVVGTASVLAWLRASGASVAAGLLHSAYTHGAFEEGAEPSLSSRAQLTYAVGTDVEKLVRMYAQLQWNPAAITALATREAVLDLQPLQRDLLLIRLANELEDHLDLAALYSLGLTEGRSYAEAFLPPARQLADLLGVPALARELERVRFEAEHGCVEYVFGEQKCSRYVEPLTRPGQFKREVARRAAQLKVGRWALRVYQRIKQMSRRPLRTQLL